jgi:hypothetical protein
MTTNTNQETQVTRSDFYREIEEIENDDHIRTERIRLFDADKNIIAEIEETSNGDTRGYNRPTYIIEEAAKEQENGN